jgi:hypothetical protein
MKTYTRHEKTKADREKEKTKIHQTRRDYQSFSFESHANQNPFQIKNACVCHGLESLPIVRLSCANWQGARAINITRLNSQ